MAMDQNLEFPVVLDVNPAEIFGKSSHVGGNLWAKQHLQIQLCVYRYKSVYMYICRCRVCTENHMYVCVCVVFTCRYTFNLICVCVWISMIVYTYMQCRRRESTYTRACCRCSPISEAGSMFNGWIPSCWSLNCHVYSGKSNVLAGSTCYT